MLEACLGQASRLHPSYLAGSVHPQKQLSQGMVHMADLSLSSTHQGVGQGCLHIAVPSSPQHGSRHLVLAPHANPKPSTRHIPTHLGEVVEGWALAEGETLSRCERACMHRRPEPTLERW